MKDDRIEPLHEGTESEVLLGFLRYQRDTLMMKCAELSPAQLATRAVGPSTLSLLGLVRHLSDVERNWTRRVLAGEQAPPLFYTDASPDGEFDDIDAETVTQADVDNAFAAWRTEVATTDAHVAAAASLDLRSMGGRSTYSLRWILVHLIEEYSRHNGHADLLRERLDGRTGE